MANQTFSPLYQKAKFLLAWQMAKLSPLHRWTVATPPKRILVIPPDPWALTGSRGDEAMICAVIDKLAETAIKRTDLALIVATEAAADAAGALGVHALRSWGGFRSTTRSILEFRPDAAFIIGADCMDGFYSPETSARFIATADILARRGVPVSFTGFSFNESPSPLVLNSFKRLASQVRVNLRDPISFERYQNACSHPANLTADVAFLLRPVLQSGPMAAVAEWIQARRARGVKVIAFNVHPHLVKNGSPGDFEALISSATLALVRVLSESDVNLLLLPHDYRKRDGDGNCLEKIYERLLQKSLGSRVIYPEHAYSAAELKGLASMVDGVITGRMHLAIASLGMGVPVAGIAYQGKFSGLLKHFDYPEEMQISAQSALNDADLYALIIRFIASIDTLRATTNAALPKVKNLSLQNLRSLTTA